ncbi:MAG: zf-HC2 domain-containing protein [Bacteroidales bacterium]|nr:zf-HC2 domain-containing protein [Candidatus Latescibacterota bacterium]
MDCIGTEKLLALYYEGKLSVETARDLEAHIASCGDCAEMADAWTSLEPQLRELKNEIPLPGLVASRVITSLGLEKKSILSIFRFGRPGFAASGLLSISIFFFIFRKSVERVLPGLSESYSTFYDSTLNSLSAWLSDVISGPSRAYIALIDGLVSAAGKMNGWYEAVDFRILLSVYILIILCMSLSFGQIVRRILRD